MFKRLARSIRNNMLVGLVLVTPIVVTGFLINVLFMFFTNRVIEFIPENVRAGRPDIIFGIMAFLVALVLLFLIGLLVRNLLGKKLYQFSDHLLARIPFVNKIYIGIRQIGEALLDQSQTMFKDVVLVEYPRKGLYSLGFTTARVPKHMQIRLPPPDNSRELVAVFVPTTPNPTSGLMILVPVEDAVKLPIDVGDAMKLVVSGGAFFPGSKVDDRPTLLDKLEEWLAKDKDVRAGEAKRIALEETKSATSDQPK
ncbi:MAG TPA: DUF502 domain-containing protein [Kiritimatiellia bacterium]|nr:DUF502 domain-containing protein [Kiritimatiellia bacterium]